MRERANAFLRLLPDEAVELGRLAFDDDARRWLEYRPNPRPGVCLADLDPPARKAAHRLLATGLSPHAYAQAMAIMALEEVLDRREGWGRRRHSDDYRVVVFGDPAADDRWSWRFEGHHLSVTMTLLGDVVHPTPVFLGANPHAVTYAGRSVLRPLAPEEDLARALLDGMGAAVRTVAVVSDTAPDDLYSGPRPRAAARIEPVGVAGARLNPTARALLDQLVAVYTARLPADLVVPVDAGDLHFAWEGGERTGDGHYYRIQAPDLLIEYDNTADAANHAHTVLRRPASDFGGDALGAHHAEVAH